MWFEQPERFHVDELADLVCEETGGELHIVLAPQPVWRGEEASGISAPPRRSAAPFVTNPTTAAAETVPYKQVGGGSSSPALGRIGNRGEPSPADIAVLLSRPEEARYGWSSDLVNGIHLRTLVAARPELGLIAVREDEEVFVRTFRCDHLSSVLTGVLPKDSWKSPEAAISVLRSEILAAAPETTGAPRPSPEVARAQALATARSLAIAEFHVEIRQGCRRHVSDPLRVYDTDEGRWAVTARPHYGDELLRFVPADARVVADLLDGLRRDLN